MSVVIEVDRRAEEPVYGQVARQIRLQVASGALPVGSRLPSVRALASDLGVNLNTIARAYRLLEDEGFVTMRDRERAEIAAPRARAGDALEGALCRELGELLARMRQAGMAIADIERAISHETRKLGRGRA